ncbi:unnamed protein product [Brassicogethes aeneus]|uniref:PHD and RING finger domain-containing protein 1 n=1 Tax=Brassicogethes aeneus TaxID=1431903 RepID=A0A9P0BAB2_BRAAE|nr:unnamed protein product [Brassicogethes aeneus]
MSNASSDAESFDERKRVLHDSSPSSSSSADSSIENVRRRVSSGRNPLPDSSSDSESGSSSIVVFKRKRPLRVTSNTDSDSSGSLIGRRSKIPARISSDFSESDSDDASDGGFQSQWETDFSDSDPEAAQPALAKKASIPEKNMDSDSSDGESDKCPICLLSFRQQEVGTPETCDHMFCLECLQEWSKNMNTCPVDRREYNLILVRKNVQGKVVNQIQIEKPQPLNEINIIEDPTSCEICCSCDFEDRMLLCDGCDLGFHLFCLTPPLDEVPDGAWFCNDCSPEDAVNQEITLQEVQLLLDDVDDDYEPLTRRLRRNSTRLVPRTRQTERVRRRIASNRINQLRETPSTSSGIDEPITSTRSRVSSTTTPRKTTKKKNKKKPCKKRRVRYRIVYKIDEATGETVAVKKRCNKKRKAGKKKKSKSRGQRPTLRPKTVKKRLAVQLGICAPKTVPQNLPDVKAPPIRNSIGLLRERAGIPALHLFGQSNQLDYFSDEDEDYIDGPDVMTRRAPNLSNVTAMRRMARRKAAIVGPSTVSSSNDILGSILDSQETFHSKSTLFSVDQNGRLKMEKKSRNNNYVDLNRQSGAIRQRPTSYTNNGTGSSSNNYRADSNSTGGDYRGNAQDQHSTPTSTIESESSNYDSNRFGGEGRQENTPQDYTQRMLSGNYDASSSENDKQKDENTGSNTPNSESEVDIYSDIETVSTSKMDEGEAEIKPSSPQQQNIEMPAGDEEDATNDSESEMVIDTEKDLEKYSEENFKEEAAVTSTVDSNSECVPEKSPQYSNKASEIQSGAIQSSNQVDEAVKSDFVDEKDHYDDEDSEDGCPNFSIYSKESQNLAQDTECLPGTAGSKPKNQKDMPDTNPEPRPYNFEEQPDFYMPEPVQLEPENNENDNPTNQEKKKNKKNSSSGGLYSDSEDESIVRKVKHSYGVTDLNKMTEDIISEEERSYTPCLDEKKEDGLEGLDTEMISDEERNDFDESHERKTASDGGDALEINAKECELDFTRPEDYEEGEIVDKSKLAKNADKEIAAESSNADDDSSNKTKKKDKGNTDGNKENETQNKESPFKKLSKSNKDRHYRDKDRSKSRDKKSDKRDKESEGRKEKMRRIKKKERRREIERYDVRALIADKPRRQKDQFGRDIRSPTRSKSRSLTPPPRRSVSRSRRSQTPKKSGRRSRLRTRSSPRKSRSKSKKRKRSPNRSRKSRKSRERIKSKKKVPKEHSPPRLNTSPIRNRLWNRSPPPKEWTPSFSRSPSPHGTRTSPSWTPPKTLEPPVKQHNLKVILANDAGKKRKDKKRKDGDRRKDDRSRKRRFDKTPPPSKEVFASGENILVSVSFNKENETRDISTREKRRKASTDEPPKKKKKTKKTAKKDLSGVKPVAIIDLDRSPFQEISSPKDVIVLSDSDNAEIDNRGIQTNICDSSQLAVSPERSVSSYAMGPKTPPEPQVKFSLTAKQPTVRAITNPLHEADEENEPNQEPSENVYKGPNTPPISPPSSPDAYDPFEPTKSRSASPEPLQNNQPKDENNISEGRKNSDEKQGHTPDVLKSMTPPVAEIQPADSQSGAQDLKSPERIGVLINQVLQPINSTSTKPVAQTVPFSSVPTSHNNSAPATNSTAPRINIINSTIVQPSSIPQRIVLPNVQKSSPVKIPPTKSIKPMPSKSKGRKRQNGTDDMMDLDSPYSPGSSDYEDLFEPPPDITTKANKNKKPANTAKVKNTFDALFGSPSYNTKKSKNEKIKKVQITPTKGKQAGSKLEEDNLKILDDLPSSAVEMQVKDKYLKKLNRQERVVEEVKLVLKPHYNKKRISKEEYKDVLRRAVPKICHNKSGEINPTKIKNLVEAYVKKLRHSKKVTSSSSVNPQKV